jgi:guanylate kinase
MGYDKKYQLHKVISTTTRYPRINEICGYDYFFTPKCALTDKKGKFLSFCVNPVSFGKDISGEHVWYCYTEKELEEPLKEGKSLFFNVIGSAVPFYKDYFSERFPNVKLISTC